MPSALPPPPPLADLLARCPPALFLDFDGTLVEIAARPEAIAVPGSIAARLRSLSDRLGGRLAVVSGRSIDDLEQHCGPLPVAVAGSHGADVRLAGAIQAGGAARALPEGVSAQVERFARAEGLLFEGKAHGAALHSRHAPDKEDKALAFMDQLASGNGLRVKRGKLVAELVHQGADKAAAVDRLMAVAPFSDGLPVFIGDDVTDEDGFAACARHGGFGIAVGERESANASYRLAAPADVIKWLGL